MLVRARPTSAVARKPTSQRRVQRNVEKASRRDIARRVFVHKITAHSHVRAQVTPLRTQTRCTYFSLIILMYMINRSE